MARRSGQYTGKIWAVLGDLNGFVMTVAGVFLLLTLNQTLLATIALVFYAFMAGIATKNAFSGPYGAIWYGKPIAGIVGAAISGLSYILLVYILPPFVQMYGTSPAGLYGVAPPTMLLILAGLWSVYTVYAGVLGGLYGGMGVGAANTWQAKVLLIVLLGVPFFFLFPELFLGGQWANAGSMFGGAGYGLEQAFGDAGEAVHNAAEGYYNTVLNPTRNPGMARLACSYEYVVGGGLYEAAAGGATISQCVDEYLGRNKTESRSKQVGQPVQIQIQGVETEPFSNHIRVLVPLTNTYVTDIQGRPINIPAQNVVVNVSWHYLDRIAAWHKKELPSDLQNGDTRTVEFNGDKKVFPTFQIRSGISNNNLETRLRDVKNNCGQPASSACETSQNWVLFRINETDGYNQMNALRVVFLVNTIPQLAWSDLRSDANDPDIVGHIINNEDNKDLNEFDVNTVEDLKALQLLAPGRDYQIEVDVTYDYRAEAAFTQSSRWRAGNQLLELWTRDAWEQLTFQERESWESEKCGSVQKFGQEIQKQRTAALTTPIVPVMYVDCGGSLFRKFAGDSDGDGNPDAEYTINLGATVRAQNIDPENGFTVHSITTDCPHDSTYTNDSPPQPVNREGTGWVYNPVEITRFDNIAGQRKTINCQMQMEFTVNLQAGTTYTVPQLQGN